MSLQTGDQAPAFEAADQNGQLVKLSDFAGKKVVLYFYPKDDTPGCTAQACNLRDNYESLLQAGYVVLGVSVDDEKSHQKFIKKYELPFPLLADADHKIVEAYGVWVEKNMYGKTYMGTARTTFVIDESGKIAQIIRKVDTKDHTSQILQSA
ncbi:thioredoxin-dependent thiol peroxidase [Siphonobacter sp. BAB-5385]|uniref:thioredoxin-dependent thiol peroxidase n=1 Tax=unclassified Siphonobacter TaxID=2635712 RepID=UPI000B9E6F87|nr:MULTISPECIES: thioredoxin-dependent thiol peroxidase [unclassified Siphonobacter]OZI06967.1 thioredoxin-dependent thiol peroxidase [Siphonobacter sp. BAB-5385]PMD95580.1 thioredoxin-dependent thiol peroxidase [Siphonobacter sp. BAB-5405]